MKILNTSFGLNQGQQLNKLACGFQNSKNCLGLAIKAKLVWLLLSKSNTSSRILIIFPHLWTPSLWDYHSVSSRQIWWSTYVIWHKLFFFFFFLNTGCLSWCNPQCFIWAWDQQLGMHQPMSDGFSVMSEDQLTRFGNEKTSWTRMYERRYTKQERYTKHLLCYVFFQSFALCVCVTQDLSK